MIPDPEKCLFCRVIFFFSSSTWRVDFFIFYFLSPQTVTINGTQLFFLHHSEVQLVPQDLIM